MDLIKKHYVALDVDNSLVHREADLAFLKAVDAGPNHRFVAAAGGKQLWSGHPQAPPDLEEALEKFKQLPPEERHPRIEKPSGNEASPGRPTVPPGCLILRAYWQYLTRDARGEVAPMRRWMLLDRWMEETPVAATDTFWLLPEEWKALVPRDPKAGDVVKIPRAVEARLASFYAVPHVLGVPGTILSGGNLSGGTLVQEARSREFTLRVDQVTASGFVLRLDGLLKAGGAYAPSDVTVHGTDVRFLGFFTYDARKRSFDRIDLLGLGTAWGQYWRGPGGVGEDHVRQTPHGIAFELVPGDRPADRFTPSKWADYKYEKEGK